MTKRMANRDITRYISTFGIPDFDIEGYGALSFTYRGYRSGYLPPRIQKIWSNLRFPVNGASRFIPTIYSYGTPIAWFDSDYAVWIRPRVSYSVTTAHHQSTLWALAYPKPSPFNNSYPLIDIPADCGEDEYHRYASQKMILTGGATIPGPHFDGR